MRKVLLFLGVIAATLTSCNKDHTHDEYLTPADISGSVQLNSIVANIETGDFNNPAGKGPDTNPLYKETVVFTLAGVTNSSVASETIVLDGATAEDVISDINAVVFDQLLIGDYTLTVEITGAQELTGSKLAISKTEYAVAVQENTSTAVQLAFSPASSYVSAEYTDLGEGGTVNSLIIDGGTGNDHSVLSGNGHYLTPGDYNVKISLQVGGVETSADSGVLAMEAGKYTNVEFTFDRGSGTVTTTLSGWSGL